MQLHKDKVKNPEKYDAGWNEKSPEKKAGLIRHWKHEIEIHEETRARHIEELERRGEKYDK